MNQDPLSDNLMTSRSLQRLIFSFSFAVCMMALILVYDSKYIHEWSKRCLFKKEEINTSSFRWLENKTAS